MRLFRRNLARKVAKANARVAALEKESAALQRQRSEAEAAMAEFESQRLRVSGTTRP